MDNVTFGAALGLAERIRDSEDEVNALRARVAELDRKLLVKTAHAEGLLAQLKAFQVAHPDSLMRRDSGKRYKDGDIKTTGRLFYEKAFDAYLVAKKVASPQRYRAD